jgi:hypothetical protein
MKLTFHCPACAVANRIEVVAATTRFACAACGREQKIAADQVVAGLPRQCLCCGNADLWRQKDFPQRLGILMVVLGAVLSSIAWGYHHPVLALSILAGFALVDMLLFWLMPDVLVCYRCRARHRVGADVEGFSGYDHELGERYRQERLRLESRPQGWGEGAETAGR